MYIRVYGASFKVTIFVLTLVLLNVNKYAFPETYFNEISTIIIYSHCYSVVENFKHLPLSLLILFKL